MQGPSQDSPGGGSIAATLSCLVPAWLHAAAGVPPGPQPTRNFLTLDQPQQRSLSKGNQETEGLWPAGACRRLHRHSSFHLILCTCINNWGKLDAARVLHRALPAGERSGRAGRDEWRKTTGMGG